MNAGRGQQLIKFATGWGPNRKCAAVWFDYYPLQGLP